MLVSIETLFSFSQSLVYNWVEACVVYDPIQFDPQMVQPVNLVVSWTHLLVAMSAMNAGAAMCGAAWWVLSGQEGALQTTISDI